jgi:hypothetical protein
MAINNLELAWQQLMKNLNVACCEHCRCGTDINEQGEHFCMNITYPCKAIEMRKYLENLHENKSH